MLAERLEKAWIARRAAVAIDEVMRFSHEGLVLGAGTLLSKSDGTGRDLAIDPSDPRLHALLSAAQGRRPTVSALAHLYKAVERWNEGQDAFAATHLALSGVERLARPEADAHRLFLAERLMIAGFEADVIIKAIETGGRALVRLQKYDPNQPRVPAGSGRTSGEWTSGDGDGAASGSTSDPSQSREVNADNITDVSDPPDNECDEAERDCIKAAIKASANDAPDDSSRFLDIANCKKAGLACDTMSWVVEDIPFIAGTGQGGAVRFPDGGVVVIKKDQRDKYYPSLFGRPPPIRRSAGDAISFEPDESPEAGVFPSPPWNAGPSESAVSNPVGLGFTGCRKIIGILATKMGGTVTERTCWNGGRWGKIIRAKIAYAFEGVPATTLVTCWRSPTTGYGIFMRMDSCCGADDKHPPSR